MLTSLKLFIILFTLAGASQDKAVVVHLESPQYPEIARQAQIQGTVNVRVAFGRTGRVLTAGSDDAGHPILRREAEENAKKWTFASGHEGTLMISYEFRLEEPKVKSFSPTLVSFDLPGSVLIVSHAPSPIRDTITVNPKR